MTTPPTSRETRPPRLARVALRLLLPPDAREVILGDLDEEFGERADASGNAGAARRWYGRMALSSLAAFWSPAHRVRGWLTRPLGGAGTGRPAPESAGPPGLRPPRGPGRVATWFGERLRDVRFAGRGWARSPGVSLMIALTLALGIGVNTAVFSMADSVLLRPVPGVRAPDEVLVVTFEKPDGNGTGVSWPNVADLRASTPGLQGLAAHQTIRANVRLDGGVPRPGEGEAVAGDYFGVLGVRPLLGRLPGPAELDDPDPPAVAVLSERFWRAAWGADAGVVGSTLEVNGTTFTVVGVTNAYEGTLRTSRSQFFVPGGFYGRLRHLPPEYGMSNRSFRFLFRLVGRPREAASPARVQTRLRAAMASLVEAFPDANAIHGEYRPTVYEGIGLSTGDRGYTARAMATLGLVVGLVLLIACANVANVLVARGVGRRGEAAVRRALGASRGRLALQHLTESIVLALPGGALGLAVAAGVLRVLARLPSVPLVGADPPTLDGRVLAFTLAATVATGLAFGLAPAVLAGRRDLASGLSVATRRGTRRTGLLRNGLTVVQIALSLTLLVGATLLVRTLASLGAVDLGFDPSGLSVHELSPDLQGYAETEVDAFADALLRTVRQAPGVDAATLTAFPPFGGSTYRTRLRPADEPDREPILPTVMSIGDGFFETLGQRILRGRDFTASEQALAPDQESAVILLNETLARKLFGDDPVVGRKVVQPLYNGPVESLVVGVVADARTHSFDEREAVAYLPYRDRIGGDVLLLIRSPRPSEDVRREVQAVAAAIDGSLPVRWSESVEAVIERATGEERIFATLLGLTALLAATLAVVGLYGVVAHTVARRRREFGIRIAVGADHRRIVRNVLRGSALLGALGIVLGWGGAAVLSRLLESRLFGVEPFDPATFVGAGAAFLALTILAALAPALSATRVDPSEALRAE